MLLEINNHDLYINNSIKMLRALYNLVWKYSIYFLILIGSIQRYIKHLSLIFANC